MNMCNSHCYMSILRLNIYILHVHILVNIDGHLLYYNTKLQLRCMSINHLKKIRIHGRRHITQRQAQNHIYSKCKMWLISKSENNAYIHAREWKHLWKKLRHCSCKQSRMYQSV